MKSLKRCQIALFPPLTHETIDKDHGRIEIRKINLLPERPLTVSFPFATQIFSIERTRQDYDGNQMSHEIVYGVSTHNPKEFGPEQILKINRDHWCIENSIHCVRDELYEEDRSRIRSKNGSQIMATLRNLAISLMRNRGIKNLSAAVKTFRVDKKALWSFLGLTPGNVRLTA